MLVAGSGPSGDFIGPDFRNAYAPGVTLTGQGQSVGLLEFDGFFSADPAAYKAKFGLNVPVQVVTLNGFSQSTTQSGPNGAPGGNKDGEVALDIEMAMAMAPGLQSVVVYEGSNADSILSAMVSPPAGIPKSFQLSASWSGWHPSVTAQQLFETMGAIDGQTFFVNAGDGRAICPSEAGDDRALPFVTVVGGTNLAMNGTGTSWQSETAAAAGGGIEIGTASPYYQNGVATAANGGSSTYRNIPDVAIVYNNVFYIAFGGQPGTTGGTSAGTPLWAAYMALVNQQAKLDGANPLGFINPTLYLIGTIPTAYAKDFNDITSGGSTQSSCGPGYNATVGYDLVTGLGSPKAALINDLITPPVPAAPPCAGIQSQLANLSPGDFKSEADYEAAFRSLQAELRTCRQQHPG